MQTFVSDYKLKTQTFVTDHKKQFLSSLHGGCLMSEAFQNCQRQITLHNNYTWYGLFSPLGILIGARAYTDEGRIRFYAVRDAGLLYLEEEEAEVM